MDKTLEDTSAHSAETATITFKGKIFQVNLLRSGCKSTFPCPPLRLDG